MIYSDHKSVRKRCVERFGQHQSVSAPGNTGSEFPAVSAYNLTSKLGLLRILTSVNSWNPIALLLLQLRDEICLELSRSVCVCIGLCSRH